MKVQLSELKKRIAEAKKQILANMPRIVEEYAHTARVISERNIIEKGFGEDYSTNEVPAFFFLGKELNATGKSFVKKKIKEKEGLNWSAFKEAQGLPTDHVTLSYTNEMWRGVGVLKVEVKGNTFIAILGHNNKAGKDKMGWNRERYGDFIMKSLSKEDRKFLIELANDEVMAIIKRIL